MPSVLLPIADGSEELETIAILNPLRRAGVDVTLASINADAGVTCARGTLITADATLADCDYDMIVLPGGMPGATNMHECAPLVEKLKSQKASGKYIAAICASPGVVFAQNDLLDSKATCYPADAFVKMVGDKYVDDENVVMDGKVLTSVGPGTALEFGLKLVGVLCGDEKAQEIGGAMKFQGKL